jgi:hypothetical protein
VHLSENRFPIAISAGSKEICRARVTLHVKVDGIQTSIEEDIKLDTGGSVSLAHSSYLKNIMSYKAHGIPKIKLIGIGGTTSVLDKAGELYIRKGDGSVLASRCMYLTPMLETLAHSAEMTGAYDESIKWIRGYGTRLV